LTAVVLNRKVILKNNIVWMMFGLGLAIQKANSVRKTLIKELVLLLVFGLTTMYWVKPHWLAETTHALEWANTYNRVLLDTLMGAPSNDILLSIPGWIMVIAFLTILLPLWRRIHRLDS
jgi:hypothetical protein